MDCGVGSFVFSQGIVSAIPLIKDPSQLHADVKLKLYRILKKILPIVILGIVRVLLVKGTEYPVWRLVTITGICELTRSRNMLPNTGCIGTFS